MQHYMVYASHPIISLPKPQTYITNPFLIKSNQKYVNKICFVCLYFKIIRKCPVKLIFYLVESVKHNIYYYRIKSNLTSHHYLLSHPSKIIGTNRLPSRFISWFVKHFHFPLVLGTIWSYLFDLIKNLEDRIRTG